MKLPDLKYRVMEMRYLAPRALFKWKELVCREAELLTNKGTYPNEPLKQFSAYCRWVSESKNE